MIKEVILAKIGLTMETGKILSWLKKEGEYVKQDDPLFEVETDKVTTVVEAFHTGYLKKIVVKEGEEVPVNTVIAYVGEKDDTLAAGETGVSADGVDKVVETEQAIHAKDRIENRETAIVKGGVPGKINASPLARRLAHEHGIDLLNLQGSGPEGRIGKEDVLAAVNMLNGKQAPETRGGLRETGIKIGAEQKLTGIKKLVAQRMKQSYADAPHIYLELTADMTEASKLREVINKRQAEDVHVTFTDILVKATARAIMRHPLLNATIKDETIFLLEDINIGIATATERGLIVPVLKKADQLSLTEISTIIKNLGEKVRAGRQHLDDLSNGTFTITNLGMFGIESFRPILNPGQAAILAVGRIKNTPVADDAAKISVKPIISLSLACDHRIVDGTDGAKFLNDLKGILENFLTSDI
jgi:pyruvate dehydrogenase E2 component (dihydrolipoamide acetyltransferase)